MFLKQYGKCNLSYDDVQFLIALALDSLDLVKEYYNCLKEVNEPLRYLEYNLLSKFKFKDFNL